MVDLNLAVRALLAFVSAMSALYIVYWAGGALIYALGLSFWISYFGALAAGAFVGRFVWRRTATIEPGFARAVMLGAFATGGVAFAAGFFGPMLFTPDANQGPLLGMFITGPLGVVAGGIGGAMYWFRRRQQVTVDRRRASVSSGSQTANQAVESRPDD